MSHFKLTATVLDLGWVKLTQIEATVDLPLHGVKCGDKGGYIEKPSNLTGNAWVSGNAWVYGNAQVSGNARVSGNAWVSDNVWVSDNAQVSGNAWVSGNAQVSGNAWVYGNAQVSGNARVSGNAQVSGNARVSGDAHIDCASAILCLAIGGFYTITLTRKHLFAGCKTIPRKQWLKLSKKDAIALGCGPELYAPLKAMIKSASLIIKENP